MFFKFNSIILEVWSDLLIFFIQNSRSLILNNFDEKIDNEIKQYNYLIELILYGRIGKLFKINERPGSFVLNLKVAPHPYGSELGTIVFFFY